MPLLHRLVPGGVLAVLLAVPLTACGATTSATTGGAGSDPAPGERETGTYDVGVEHAAYGTDPRRLVLTVALPTGEDCPATAHAEVYARDAYTVAVNATATSPIPYPTHCPESKPAQVRLAIPALRDRTLVVNGTEWEDRDGVLTACHPTMGCDAPADRCDPAWTHALTSGVELPPEQSTDLVACAGDWMIADVDAVVTGCQSLDGSTPPAGCEGSGVHRRWYAHWDGETWDVVASGTAAGCADVAGVPGFPRRLCEDLPAR